MFSVTILALGGAVLSFMPGALAGFSSGASDNVVIYWGAYLFHCTKIYTIGVADEDMKDLANVKNE